MPTWLIVTACILLIVLGIFGSIQVSALKRRKNDLIEGLKGIAGLAPSITLMKTDFISSVNFCASIDSDSKQVCLMVNGHGSLLPRTTGTPTICREHNWDTHKLSGCPGCENLPRQ